MKKLFISLLVLFLTGCSGWKYMHNGLYLLKQKDKEIAFSVFGDPTNIYYIGDGDTLYSWYKQSQYVYNSGYVDYWGNYNSTARIVPGSCLVQIRVDQNDRVIDSKYQGDKGTCDSMMVQAGRFCKEVRNHNPEKDLGWCKYSWYKKGEYSGIVIPPTYKNLASNTILQPRNRVNPMGAWKGCKKSIAFQVLGIPDSQTKIDGKDVYTWSLPGNHGFCNIKMLIDQNGSIQNISLRDGGSCTELANDIYKHYPKSLNCKKISF